MYSIESRVIITGRDIQGRCHEKKTILLSKFTSISKGHWNRSLWRVGYDHSFIDLRFSWCTYGTPSPLHKSIHTDTRTSQLIRIACSIYSPTKYESTTRHYHYYYKHYWGSRVLHVKFIKAWLRVISTVMQLVFYFPFLSLSLLFPHVSHIFVIFNSS